MKRKIRILLAKPGLDGHDVGVKVVAHGLKDAGFEVIYLGLRQTPEAIAEAARDEDVDVIGVSILSGAHLPLCAKLRDLFITQQLHDKLWIVGGNIPENDRDELRRLGYRGVFPTGTPLDEISSEIRRYFS
ncbi:MAG: cobalamin-dependent protein [Nitrospinaceae bacterium]|jgi:methylmalonyl-CoA mutase C-terminal domain/subunit|nr:cobalamin-dependent protein [Nitrospinaceae bacterium]MDP6734885.1 cobalamin-dependent protein [Nitrospinaceae bacterium]